MSACALALLSLLAAAEPPPCATPRQAAATFLGSLRGDRLDARRAAHRRGP